MESQDYQDQKIHQNSDVRANFAHLLQYRHAKRASKGSPSLNQCSHFLKLGPPAISTDLYVIKFMTSLWRHNDDLGWDKRGFTQNFGTSFYKYPHQIMAQTFH